MSHNNSTMPAPSDKPAKPSPDFPLFPHATKRWAKKIKGKMRYFGPWDDPAGALARYLREKDALETGRTLTPADDTPSTPADAEPVDKIDGNDETAFKHGRAAPSRKPNKPRPDFPLFPHASGQWAKKIRGHMHYFGHWNDPDAALAKYDAEKNALHVGRKPRVDPEGVTIKDVVNGFLNHKKGLLDAGELTAHTWAKYKTATDEVIAAFGKSRLATDVGPDDFAALRKRMAKKWGVHRLSDMIQHVRSIFKHAFDAELIDRPVRFGPGFKRPSKKVIRLNRAEAGPKLFAASEVRCLIDAAGPSMRAMILLGINCGFGNADCGTLPMSAIDLDNAIIHFPRPKTGIARRCPLWPETIAALRDALAQRHDPKSEEDASLVFITHRGQSFQASEKDRPISQVMAWLLRRLDINGRRGLGFYTLRHTFRTVADESKDQPAVDFIMGHEVPHMSAVYRETISDERLRAVADHVRKWLFPTAASIDCAE